MKTSLSVLLLLPAVLAHAQRGEFGRNDGGANDRGRAQVEGRYEALQREGSIRRTLRLERDGTAEVVTESKDANRDRRSWSREDAKRYGKTGTVAVQDRAVRHLGRWRWDRDEVVIQFDDVRAGGDRWNSIEMRLSRKDDGLTFDRDTDAYGTYRIVFHRDAGWNGGRPGGSRFGALRYDNDTLPIESVELIEGVDRDRSRLRIRAGGRLIEAEGRIVRTGDDVSFHLRDRGGEYQLRMRNSQVMEITGRADIDRHRVDIARP